MKTLSSFQLAGLLLGLLLLNSSVRADEADNSTEEQLSTESTATVESPAPARKQYIDPFSGMPLPEYSYTNSLPVPARWRTLTVDPFSRTPLPPLVAPAPPKPKVVEESEPEFTPPLRFDLPPGASVSRAPIRPIMAAIHEALRPWLISSSETDRWDFPPGARLRKMRETR